MLAVENELAKYVSTLSQLLKTADGSRFALPQKPRGGSGAGCRPWPPPDRPGRFAAPPGRGPAAHPFNAAAGPCALRAPGPAPAAHTPPERAGGPGSRRAAARRPLRGTGCYAARRIHSQNKKAHGSKANRTMGRKHKNPFGWEGLKWVIQDRVYLSIVGKQKKKSFQMDKVLSLITQVNKQRLISLKNDIKFKIIFGMSFGAMEIIK